MTTALSEAELAAAKAYPLRLLVERDLPLKRSGRLLTACCPFHNECTPSFFVYPDHYHCFACGAHGGTIDYLRLTRRIGFVEAVRELCGRSGGYSPQRSAGVAAPILPATVAPRSPYVAELWAGADRPRLAELYLWSRGIRVRPKPLPDAIRGHGRVWCAETRQFRPAVLAALQDETGTVRALQRIWCEASIECGDAMPEKGTRSTDLAAGKKTVGVMGQAAVRLSAPGPVLGLAEGIESALSAAQLFSLPVWAACGASRLGSVHVPDVVREIIIFGDDGAAGHDAAMKAVRAYRTQGMRASAEFPPPGARDWNDFLREPV